MSDAVELRPTDHWNGHKAYEVLVAGERVGIVQQCFPTFERGPRQRMWVTKRWTAKRPYWEYRVGDGFGTSTDYPTRKRAVEQLIREVARAN